MNPTDPASGRDSNTKATPRHISKAEDGGPTGVPFFRTWSGVYTFALGSFVLWVALLAALTRTFS